MPEAREETSQDLRALDVALRSPCEPGAVRVVAPSGAAFELPPTVLEVFRRAVHHLAQNQAVAVVPYAKRMLTTQEAADLLSISRPHLIKLLAAGEMPFAQVGTHRRIRLQDLLFYRVRRDTDRRHAVRSARPGRLSRQAGNDLLVNPDGSLSLSRSELAHFVQSTNEELETTNEELQSINEELETNNEELLRRGDELDTTNAFLTSVLGGMRSGLVVVDQNFEILAWNRQSEDLWGLRSEEVLGKNFLNLDIGLPVQELRTQVRDCLSGGAKRGGTTVDVINRRGQQIRVTVYCTPLAASPEEIRGVILMMEEPTA